MPVTMFSTRSFLATSALMGSVLAQSTSVTSLLLYGFEGDNIVASVIAVAPGATQYFVTCSPGTDSAECGFGPGATFTEGPSTLGIHLTESGVMCVVSPTCLPAVPCCPCQNDLSLTSDTPSLSTMDVDCAITSNAADCTETVAGPSANYAGITSAVVHDISESLSLVTITAGLELLSGASSTATATGSSSTSGSTMTQATTGASVTGTTATETAASTASGSTATDTAAATGAAHQLGQNVAAGGLVGLAGIVLML